MEAKLQKNPNLDKVIAPIMLSRIALLLSLQSKLYEPDIVQRRNQMIEAENLHIGDKITEEQLKLLYTKYGEGLNEKEFAMAFLDVYDEIFWHINKKSEIIILTEEYVSDEEFGNIKRLVKITKKL